MRYIEANVASSAVVALFRQLHEELRNELQEVDERALNWAPVPGANSIATIVTHLLGSEAETMRAVAGVPLSRDRDAEFVGEHRTMSEVLTLLDESDALIDELEPRLDGERLSTEVSLPTLPPDEIRPGVTWLVGNYGHAREHVGQVQLTKQLAQQGRSSS